MEGGGSVTASQRCIQKKSSKKKPVFLMFLAVFDVIYVRGRISGRCIQKISLRESGGDVAKSIVGTQQHSKSHKSTQPQKPWE